LQPFYQTALATSYAAAQLLLYLLLPLPPTTMHHVRRPQTWHLLTFPGHLKEVFCVATVLSYVLNLYWLKIIAGTLTKKRRGKAVPAETEARAAAGQEGAVAAAPPAAAASGNGKSKNA
jgi:hypothetical protein